MLRRVCSPRRERNVGEEEFGPISSANPAYTCIDAARRHKPYVSQTASSSASRVKAFPYFSSMTRHVVDETELQGSGTDFLAAHGDSLWPKS